jgi:hypothetical protein
MKKRKIQRKIHESRKQNGRNAHKRTNHFHVPAHDDLNAGAGSL